MGKIILHTKGDAWEIVYQVGRGGNKREFYRETVPKGAREELKATIEARIDEIREHTKRGKFVPAFKGGSSGN